MKLKMSMLLAILRNVQEVNKYSKAYLNLKTVLELEGGAIKKEYHQEFKEITKQYNSFIDGIPLKVIERKYYEKEGTSSKHINIEYENKEFREDVTIMDLYMMFEDFYNKMFLLASKIADMYNLEVKFNDNKEGSVNYI